jgi:hypothetical protein
VEAIADKYKLDRNYKDKRNEEIKRNGRTKENRLIKQSDMVIKRRLEETEEERAYYTGVI